MTDPAEVTQQPLLTIKTVKRKHLKGLEGNALTRWPEQAPEIIGLIEEWHALLCRTSKGRIELIREWAYREYLWELAKSAPDRQAKIDEANRIMEELPQLFLD